MVDSENVQEDEEENNFKIVVLNVKKAIKKENNFSNGNSLPVKVAPDVLEAP